APPTEPWLYENPDFTDYFRRCAELKYSLMPYIEEQAKECTANGWPMLRALLVEFPDDPGAWMVEDQYMFGSDILVAPLLTEADSRNVYLPAGQNWKDYQTGKTYTPGWHRIAADSPIKCNILVREGAKIPTVAPAQSTSAIDRSTLRVTKY
ncbi:MAG: alpha-xylosidase, partial [Duncaniella sp.]|nr:alpha-xylosidase [Duncaniella sp.]